MKLFSLLFLFCLAFVTQAQPVSAFTPPSGYIDSATVKYATATLGTSTGLSTLLQLQSYPQQPGT